MDVLSGNPLPNARGIYIAIIITVENYCCIEMQ